MANHPALGYHGHKVAMVAAVFDCVSDGWSNEGDQREPSFPATAGRGSASTSMEIKREQGDEIVCTCRIAVSFFCLAAILALGALTQGAEAQSGGPAVKFDPLLQFEHIGIFTADKKAGQRLVAATQVWVTDFSSHPYRVEWLRTERPFQGPNPHVAFRVENIEKAAKAAKGLKPTSKPFDAGIARVGFFRTDDGATVEFMEYGAKAAARPSAAIKFDHVGLITTEKKAGETFVPATKVWVTAIPSHPYRVEWLRFEPDTPVKGPVRQEPHVAFSVPSIAQAAKGLKVLLPPFDAGIAKVGFYQADDGAVVEFMEYYKR